MDEDVYVIFFTCFLGISSGAVWFWLIFLNGATSLVKKAEESDKDFRKKLISFMYTPSMIIIGMTLIFFGNIFAVYLSIAQYLRNHP